MSEQELIVIENPAAVFVDNGGEDVLEMVRAKVLPLVEEAERLEAERKAEEERRIVERVEREKAAAVAEVQRKAEANQAAAVAAERNLVQQEIDGKRIAYSEAKDRAKSVDNPEAKMKLRRSVHSDIRQSLFRLGLDLPTVDAVEDAMIKGRIPHVSITY